MAKTCVIDASVALKWYLDDEEFVDEARELLRDYGDGKLIINVPDLFFVEIGNAFNVAVTRQRIEEEEAFEALREMLELDIAGIDCQEFLIQAWKFARLYKCSFYDSLYIAVSDSSGCDFYTGDSKFYNILKSSLKWIRWIGNYKK